MKREREREREREKRIRGKEQGFSGRSSRRTNVTKRDNEIPPTIDDGSTVLNEAGKPVKSEQTELGAPALLDQGSLADPV